MRTHDAPTDPVTQHPSALLVGAPTPLVGLVALALLGGCNAATLEMQPGSTYDAGLVTGDAAPEEEEVDPAAIYRSTIEPLLDNRCGACHDADRTGPAFLASPSYETLFGYPAIIDLRDPTSSRLLTKGAHAGPAWPASEAERVREWIRMEAARRMGGGDEEEDVADGATEPRDIVPGLNVVELSEAAPELEGARLTFVATRTAAGVFLAELKVYAGEGGVRLRHPVLVTYRGGLPEPDPVDRFNGIEVSVGAYESAPIGSGSVSLVAFPDDAQLGFLFGSIGRSGGGGDPEDPEDPEVPVDGCRAVAAFTAQAQPQLSAFCASCHSGGNATATSALDMTGVGNAGNADAQRRACGQVLGVINPANPSASSVWRAPDRSSDLTGHDFKFPTTTQLDDFRAALSRWLSMED
ncbi:MAG: hypothetical protein KF901_05520 [Myxococcales bacterium]|nr:hypothetical protein [Myxococcales bacterium]